jgi:hypothetical protein
MIDPINQFNLNLFKKTIASVVIILAFNTKVLAQVQGGVFDEKKQGIANAFLIAKDTTGNIIDTIRSDKRGFYSFKSLKKGKYNIEARATGFTPKIFEKIEVINEDTGETNGRNDISGATRLEVYLIPAKTRK